MIISSSIKVATFGTGGGGEVGVPNGFFDPVCCATRGFVGPGKLVVSGRTWGKEGQVRCSPSSVGKVGVATFGAAFAVAVRMANPQ